MRSQLASQGAATASQGSAKRVWLARGSRGQSAKRGRPSHARHRVAPDNEEKGRDDRDFTPVSPRYRRYVACFQPLTMGHLVPPEDLYHPKCRWGGDLAALSFSHSPQNSAKIFDPPFCYTRLVPPLFYRTLLPPPLHHPVSLAFSGEGVAVAHE